MQKLQADSSRQPVIFSRLLKSGALVFLVICTFVLYGPTIDFPFLTLDDPLYVTKHDTIQQGFGKEAIRLAFTEPHAGFWIPLTWLSFMVDYEFSGLLPGGYRLTNILLHCANVLLLFTFIYYLTGYYWRSLLVAGLFAFHPLHVESVVWITERKDVLSLFFLLLACLSYARYAKKPGFLHYLAIVFLYLLGLMAKPMLVTFPFLLLILDYWPLNRFNKNAVTSTVNKPQVSRHSATRLLVEKIPLFIISLFFSIATFMIQNNKGATETFTAHPLLFRIENAIVSYVKYIVLTFWPDRLGLLYPFPEFYSTWQVAFAFVFLFATTFLVVRAGRRLPFLPAGWLWFMVALVPVIGLVQVGYQSHADRFTYIPNIGLYLICAFTAAACVKRWPPVKIPVIALLTVLLVAIYSQGRRQTSFWQDNVTLYSHSLEIGKSQILHRLLGASLLDRGDYSAAAQQFQAAIAMNPASFEAGTSHYNLGVIYSKRGDREKSIAHYRKTLSIIPTHLDSHINLAIDLSRENRLPEAMFFLLDVLEHDPQKVKAYTNLGNIYYQLKDFDSAIEEYDEALNFAPYSWVDHYSKGMALLRYGCYSHAAEHLQKAIYIEPDFDRAHELLAVAFKMESQDFENILLEKCQD